MANSLKLYVDTQTNRLVQSESDASDFTLPTFFSGRRSRAVREHTDGWRLFTVAFDREQPAGSRLLKKEPWPIDRFVFPTQEEANDAAEALAKYLGTKVIDDSKQH